MKFRHFDHLKGNTYPSGYGKQIVKQLSWSHKMHIHMSCVLGVNSSEFSYLPFDKRKKKNLALHCNFTLALKLSVIPIAEIMLYFEILQGMKL
ncbi:hypothetical protein RHSIM_Rhsim01G0084400 [Rhododendron simsii]|uniref:Uncharacterized protein n=1 Tax=Rhododendron simsii TaxID=118357 RepID=A0A834HUI4_RHOSS|nr:hypothetical protein RHSIM_Rhsim01G0084400 [Rhododendron simsii]